MPIHSLSTEGLWRGPGGGMPLAHTDLSPQASTGHHAPTSVYVHSIMSSNSSAMLSTQPAFWASSVSQDFYVCLKEDCCEVTNWIALTYCSWIPWNLSFRYILFHEKRLTLQHQSQFTPKMKATAIPRLLSSLVWIDQCNECNRMTSSMEFMSRFVVFICWCLFLKLWTRFSSNFYFYLQ